MFLFFTGRGKLFFRTLVIGTGTNSCVCMFCAGRLFHQQWSLTSRAPRDPRALLLLRRAVVSTHHEKVVENSKTFKEKRKGGRRMCGRKLPSSMVAYCHLPFSRSTSGTIAIPSLDPQIARPGAIPRRVLCAANSTAAAPFDLRRS